MTDDGGRIVQVAIRSIVVQGLPLRPGDRVLVNIDGTWVQRIYEGWVKGKGAWMEFDNCSSHPHNDPGPYKLRDLRHPDLLTGLAKHLDGEG